jgi:hypothetical protein
MLRRNLDWLFGVNYQITFADIIALALLCTLIGSCVK